MESFSGPTPRVECEAMIREAIELHLEGLREEGLPVPRPSSVAGMVEIPGVPAA